MDKIAKYVEHYDNHYKLSGLRGAGTGEFMIKLQLWYAQGYKDGMSVLDYGCGWGAMLPGITNKKDYLGVDISPEAIRLAKLEFPGSKFEVSQIGKLKTGKFDWVAAMSVFTHTPFETTLDSLRDIKQAMKGPALVDFMVGEDNPKDIHVRHYGLGEWEKYLKQAGLKGTPAKTIMWPGNNLHHYWKLENDD